jgi:hypothetical protein
VPALPRNILIERGNGPVSGDTAELIRTFYRLPRRITPLLAARWIQQTICDYYPYEYRKVARDDPAAVIDVYRAAPDYQRENVERDCKYVTALARIRPTCCFCNGPMKYGEEGGWDYGYDAQPATARGKRCCSGCHDTKVRPAREAQRAADEAAYRAYVAARRGKRDAGR